MNIVERARVFATAAHAAVGQKRKYTGEDYIVHPIQVMTILSTVECTDAQLAAALLHDVVEDTSVTIEQIEAEFGMEVAELVGWVTDISKPEDGNRAVRKAIDCDHITRAPAEAQSIKLADLISNTQSIVKHDPQFAKTYLAEKVLILDVLTKGDAKLRTWAYDCYHRGTRQLDETRLQNALEKMEAVNE